jgi:hypothetical protein
MKYLINRDGKQLGKLIVEESNTEHVCIEYGSVSGFLRSRRRLCRHKRPIFRDIPGVFDTVHGYKNSRSLLRTGWYIKDETVRSS